MMWLTTTQRQILIGLLSSDRAVTIQEIAKALSLSAGTVRRQLPAISVWLEKNGSHLDRPEAGKIQVGLNAQTPRQLLAALASEDSPTSTLGYQERFDLLTFALHVSSEPRITQDFQNLLQVSRSTVLEDLSRVAEWYESRHLFLVRRPNYGVKLMGKESDWRKVFIELITLFFDEPTLFHFCTEARASNKSLALLNPPLAREMTGYLTSLKLNKARELVRFAETRLRTRFVDADHLVLTLHIALLIKRVSEGNLIEMDAAQIQALGDQPAYLAAVEIVKVIEDHFRMSVPSSEVAHLAVQILGSKLDNRVLRELPSEAGDLAYALLRKAAGQLKRPLDEDHELAARLAAHLGPTLERLVRDLPIRNPLLDDIRARYPDVYATAEASSTVVREYTGREVPADEIAYIAMYLAGALMRYEELLSVRALIVCPSGSATSWLLHSRLKKTFPNIQVQEICSTRDLQRGVPPNVELLISTVPLTQSEAPVVVVNALLTAEDILKIQKAVEAITKYSA